VGDKARIGGHAVRDFNNLCYSGEKIMGNDDDCVDPEVCIVTHRDLTRRIDVVETSQSALDKKFDSHLEKLYVKIETETLSFATKAIDASKRPGWAAVSIIAFLSSLSVGLLVKLAGQ
jgi:hypothetical protein